MRSTVATSSLRMPGWPTTTTPACATTGASGPSAAHSSAVSRRWAFLGNVAPSKSKAVVQRPDLDAVVVHALPPRAVHQVRAFANAGVHPLGFQLAARAHGPGRAHAHTRLVVELHAGLGGRALRHRQLVGAIARRLVQPKPAC